MLPERCGDDSLSVDHGNLTAVLDVSDVLAVLDAGQRIAVSLLASFEGRSVRVVVSRDQEGLGGSWRVSTSRSLLRGLRAGRHR